MTDRNGFSEIHWGSSGLSSKSWSDPSTVIVDGDFGWVSTQVRTLHIHSGVKVRRFHGLDDFETVQVLSSTTQVNSPNLLDRSLSDFTSARDLLYHWEHNKKGRVASLYAVFYVEHNFSDMNLGAINSLLLSVSPKRLTEWSMVALLRASFSAKHMLPGWSHFFGEVKEELKNNARAERLLIGLDD